MFFPLWLIRGFATRGCQHRRRQGRGGNVLWRVPGGMRPAMHAKDFDSALVKRNRALTQLIEDANKFLHDNPPGAIGPPVTRNNYFDSLGEFSTSSFMEDIPR